MDNNVMTMKYIGEDDLNSAVFKCIETGILYKSDGIKDLEGDTSLIRLYTCGNELDGDMGFPIDNNLQITFADIPTFPNKDQRFNYQMLSRLQMDCDYYLGNGGRYAGHLWAGDEAQQIEKMKELHNSFAADAKPEWLTMEQINDYSNKMLNK